MRISVEHRAVGSIGTGRFQTFLVNQRLKEITKTREGGRRAREELAKLPAGLRAAISLQPLGGLGEHELVGFFDRFAPTLKFLAHGLLRRTAETPGHREVSFQSFISPRLAERAGRSTDPGRGVPDIVVA